MRTIHTFVLRLFVDSEEPSTLRGSLRAISCEAEYPFANANALFDLLQRLVALSTGTRATKNGGALKWRPQNPANEDDEQGDSE